MIGSERISNESLRDIPIGKEVTLLHQFLVAESGFWSWETELITGVVYKHCNSEITLVKSGHSIVPCNNRKDEVRCNVVKSLSPLADAEIREIMSEYK